MYRVAAVGDRRPEGASGSTGCAGGRGLRGGAVCAAARGRPQGLASARCTSIPRSTEFALELRTSLIVLFALAALAVSTHVSIMLAGFALGLVIAAVGEPRRLARQLFGITEGFFSPLFFVWLGASLQVRELGSHPKLILLGVGLGLGAVLAHCAGRLLGQPLTLAALSAAQLGVPVAAATIGTEEHLLVTGEASALMLGALLTIACTSIAGAFAARGQAVEKATPSHPHTLNQPHKPANTGSSRLSPTHASRAKNRGKPARYCRRDAPPGRRQNGRQRARRAAGHRGVEASMLLASGNAA